MPEELLLQDLFSNLYSQIQNMGDITKGLSPITDKPQLQAAQASSTRTLQGSPPQTSPRQDANNTVQETLGNLMNKNIKSITKGPDGSQKIDLHDDAGLVSQVLGLPAQLPSRSEAIPSGPLETTATPEAPTDGGGFFDFLGQFGDNNALAMLLGGIAQAVGGGDTRIPGVGLGKLAQDRAQNEVFGELFQNLLGQGNNSFSH